MKNTREEVCHMKKARILTALVLAFALLFGLSAAQAATNYAYGTSSYDYLIGAMEARHGRTLSRAGRRCAAIRIPPPHG